MMTARDPDAEFAAATRAQAVAANPTTSAYAMANAGSGKTKVLIDRVARLLLKRPDGRPGAEPESILCITYTRAAASEMLSRLYGRLGAWAVMEDAPLRAALRDLEGRPDADYPAEQLKAARALFARALETPGGLRIETIHAFCARVLRRFPIEAGVAPGFVELDEVEAAELWRRARSEAILAAAASAPEALARLSREAGHDGALSALDALKGQAAAFKAFAAEHGGSVDKMLVKLKAIIHPAAEDPETLLEQAFGGAFPAVEIKRCIDVLRRGSKNDQTLTGHLEGAVTGASLADRYGAYLSVFFTEKGEPRQKPLYTKPSATNEPLLAELFGLDTPQGRETARMLGLKDDIARTAAYARNAALVRIGWPAIAAFDRMKAERGALDFDDLIDRTRALIEAQGLSSWVLYKLDGGITHVLLDEAQDTSPSQWALIRSLTHEFTSGQGTERAQEPRTTFLVGDEKQSIYAFQGADPAAFLAEARALKERDPSTQQVDMLMSFRSSPEILTFVDTVWNAAPVVEVPFAAERPLTADLVRHSAKRAREPGFVELWPIEKKEAVAEADPWTQPVDAMSSASPKLKLASAVAGAVREMLSGGAHVWETDKGTTRPAHPGDVLVLVRERSGGLFEALINALKSAGVPVAGADRLRLTDHIGVQDCLNLMRFALLPSRDLTLAEILRGPFGGLGDDDRYLYPLAQGRGAGETLWSRVQASNDPDVTKVRRFLEGLIVRVSLPAFEFLSHVLETPDSDGRTGWDKLQARLGSPLRDPLEALLSQALAFDAQAAASMQAFVARMEAMPVLIKRDLAEAGRAVRVMTVHGAKGLEAPIVILPDTTAKPKLKTGSLLKTADALVWAPGKASDIDLSKRARAVAEARALEEHRRLLYVALTRAKDRLLIAGHWFGSEGKTSSGYDADSWYALCLEGMQQLGGAEQADGRLTFGTPPPASRHRAAAPDAASRLPEWIRRAPPAERAHDAFVAPTGLVAARSPVLAPFDARRAERLRRGRLIHSLLQYLPELPSQDRPAAADAFLGQVADLPAAERAEIKTAALAVLADPAMGEVFQPGGRAEVAVIGTSAKLPPGTIINGRVDRLVVTPKRVLVVDFKTDQPPPQDTADISRHYVLQMAAYAAVLETAYPGREIVAALCWTDGPNLMTLPDALLSETLKSVLSTV
jgi:ATP-dependent helicase/nuclease subunit A